MAVLALVIVALLGMLLVNLFFCRRQLASYNDLSLQYSALSQEHAALKAHCATLEQTVRDAQGRAESAERELEAIQQLSINAETTPEQTEPSGIGITVQRKLENE